MLRKPETINFFSTESRQRRRVVNHVGSKRISRFGMYFE